uniref:DUF2693 domain-containing protein n=1 Tax=Rhabditophanes sp. KR3021 TaxID=114890 RepID=A0AC35UGD1_9BILA
MSSPIKELENLGWGINTDALRKYCGDDYKDSLTSTEIQKMILDIDIKVYGKCILQNALDKQKGVLKGPIVLQLSKWRNISHADGFDDHYDSKKDYARMTLTDGNQFLNFTKIDNNK